MGSAQIALLAGERAGEGWCSSMPDDMRKDAVLAFVSFV